MSRPRQRERVIAGFVLCLAIFAFTFPATQLAAEGFGTPTATALRFLLAALPLLVVARPYLRVPGVERRALLVLGGYAMGGQSLFMMIGIDDGGSALGALVLGLEPVGISLLAVAILRERPTRGQLGALGLGLAGVVVVSGVLTVGLAGASLRAVVFLLGTVILFSIYTVRVRQLAQTAHPLAVSALSLTGATIATVPLVLIDVARGTVVHDGVDGSAILSVLFIAGGTAIAYVLFAYVLQSVPAAAFAVGLYALPTLGVGASWLIVGDGPIGRDLVGGALILTAVWVGSRTPRATPAAVPG